VTTDDAVHDTLLYELAIVDCFDQWRGDFWADRRAGETCEHVKDPRDHQFPPAGWLFGLAMTGISFQFHPLYS